MPEARAATSSRTLHQILRTVTACYSSVRGQSCQSLLTLTTEPLAVQWQTVWAEAADEQRLRPRQGQTKSVVSKHSGGFVT